MVRKLGVCISEREGRIQEEQLRLAFARRPVNITFKDKINFYTSIKDIVQKILDCKHTILMTRPERFVFASVYFSRNSHQLSSNGIILERFHH